jgi:hypothetical protein
VYRVLYASSQRLGCFIETLARFRVDVSFVADLALIENGEDDFMAFGTVRRAWLKGRCIGTANVAGEYADIYALEWVSHLRTTLAGIAVQLGMKDFDLSSLERAEPRLLTQRAGRIAFELGFAGVFYHSRYGHSIENWAIFEDWTMSERFPIHQRNSRKVAEDDPDLLEALRILGLVIGDRGSNPNAVQFHQPYRRTPLVRDINLPLLSWGNRAPSEHTEVCQWSQRGEM